MFPDTWWIFACGFVCGVTGIVLWRRSHALEKRRDHAVARGADNDPTEILVALKEPAQRLYDDIDELNADEILRRADQLLEDFVLPFAEVRHRVIDRFGMTRGAEILVTVALGERMLNRTWSAAADGHLPEARASYPESIHAFREATRLCHAAASPDISTVSS